MMYRKARLEVLRINIHTEMTPAEALDKAVDVAGSLQVVADVLGVTKGAVGQWKLPGRRVPAEHCPAIERLVKRAVTCEQLRPDVDWPYLRECTQEEVSP